MGAAHKRVFTGETRLRNRTVATFVYPERAGAMNDAISYAEKKGTCLERLPWTEDVQKRIIEARTALGGYRIRMLYFAEAWKKERGVC